jgi:hypothetical protein
MKNIIFVLGLALVLASPVQAKEETKDIKVGNKTVEARVPKSAKIDCKDKANAEKTECKKPSKEMPKVEKPKEAPPADAKKK